MNFFLDAFKKYATFSGRATRQEYWMYILFYAIFYVVLAILPAIVGSGASILLFVYLIATLLPTLAIQVRRLHDANHSGWWVLLSPVALIFSFMPSTIGANRFGPASDSAVSPALA